MQAGRALALRGASEFRSTREVEEIAAANDNHLAETATATLGREIDYTLTENSEQVLAGNRRLAATHRSGACGAC